MVLKVVNLGVKVDEGQVLDSVTMYLEEGHTYVLFGQNGSGKSTLLQALIGNPAYDVAHGRILLHDKDITRLSTDERVRQGLGISFQVPPAVDGVKLRDVLEYCRRLSGMSWDEVMEYVELLNMERFLDRPVNKGFSGGEAKRSEILQLMVIDPDLLLLDEPDSGVDIENLALMGRALNKILRANGDKTTLIITHTGYILNYVEADYGMIIHDGKIACMGNPEHMFKQIMERGYEECVRTCFSEDGENNLFCLPEEGGISE